MHILEKNKRSKMNLHSFHILKLEKEEQIKFKESRRKNGKKKRAEINEIQNS